MIKPHLYYDRKGKPISLEEFAKLTEQGDYRFLQRDETPKGKYVVSTVWLGIDHAFGFGGKPLIFETMVFKPKKRPKKLLLSLTAGNREEVIAITDPGTPVAQLRGSTEQEALEDHKQLLEEWSEKERWQ